MHRHVSKVLWSFGPASTCAAPQNISSTGCGSTHSRLVAVQWIVTHSLHACNTDAFGWTHVQWSLWDGVGMILVGPGSSSTSCHSTGAPTLLPFIAAGIDGALRQGVLLVLARLQAGCSS
jgi:hypothetical protein